MPGVWSRNEFKRVNKIQGSTIQIRVKKNKEGENQLFFSFLVFTKFLLVIFSPIPRHQGNGWRFL